MRIIAQYIVYDFSPTPSVLYECGEGVWYLVKFWPTVNQAGMWQVTDEKARILIAMEEEKARVETQADDIL